jgi:hypothetical protein
MAPDGSDPVQVTKVGAFSGAAAFDNSVFYLSLQTPPIRHIAPDGTDDGVVVPDSASQLFTTKNGLWFWTTKPGQPTHIWLFRSADNKLQDMATLDFRPGFNIGLSVSPDERYVLVTRPDPNGTDLFLVNDFR